MRDKGFISVTVSLTATETSRAAAATINIPHLQLVHSSLLLEAHSFTDGLQCVLVETKMWEFKKDKTPERASFSRCERTEDQTETGVLSRVQTLNQHLNLHNVQPHEKLLFLCLLSSFVAPKQHRKRLQERAESRTQRSVNSDTPNRQ